MTSIGEPRVGVLPSELGRSRIPALDGLRGLAILLVMVFHALDIQLDAIPFPAIHAIAISGWSGVSLFFVLSGFLITGILLDLNPVRRSLGHFYARRALRILPLYYVTLFIFFYLIPRESFPQMAWHDDREILYWTFLQNWAMAARGSFLNAPNLNHLWSLNIEEQFYLFWPLLVFGLRRRRLLWLCGGLVVGCLGLRVLLLVNDAPWVPIYIMTITRMDDLAVGAAIACILRSPNGLQSILPVARVVGGLCAIYVLTAMVMTGGFLLRSDWTLTVGFSVASLGFGSALVGVLSAQSGGLATRILSNSILRAFGKYSYALYVVHLPIVIWLMVPNGANAGWSGTALYLWHLGVTIALSFAVAFISWHVLEYPFQKLKSRFG
ncbi:MAG TPA: acyltransferase [Myxococcales bacterium]|nr:acyltransferase [Myxococcales bacterium]